MRGAERLDVLIVGAGAAGLMCAIEAGRRGRRTLVIDHADRAGKKILISGGGRANFTNLHCTHANFLSDNANFARSALARFTPEDMIALVERHRIAYHEKTLGQLFCDRSARDLVDALLADVAEAGARIALEVRLNAVTQIDRGFVVETTQGTVTASSLVVATGGLSIPQMGATGFGYELARQFGLKIVAARPALVPLTFGPDDRDRWCDLAGLSAETIACAQNGRRSGTPSFREKTLITHRGLSGPAILQASSYWQPGKELLLDLAPGLELARAISVPGKVRRDAGAILTVLRDVLPARLAERWLSLALPAEVDPGKALSNATLAELERRLHGWAVTPAGSEGYAKAEVTAGGVSTAELQPQTLEARRVPGLYFIGEVVDVTGWLGGFNFQWAWASGVCAGQSA